MASLIRKGMNLARAYIKWAAAGKPLRDDEYIFDLFDSHCSKCPLFIRHNATQGECDECGCYIKRISAQEDDFNKLAWPTEECPEGHWGSDVDAPMIHLAGRKTGPSEAAD